MVRDAIFTKSTVWGKSVKWLRSKIGSSALFMADLISKDFSRKVFLIQVLSSLYIYLSLRCGMHAILLFFRLLDNSV